MVHGECVLGTRGAIQAGCWVTCDQMEQNSVARCWPQMSQDAVGPGRCLKHPVGFKPVSHVVLQCQRLTLGPGQAVTACLGPLLCDAVTHSWLQVAQGFSIPAGL